MGEQINAPEVTEASKEKVKEAPKQTFDKAFNKIKDHPFSYVEDDATINISAKGLSDGSRQIFMTRTSEVGGSNSQIVTIDKAGSYSARFAGVINGQSMGFPLESDANLDPDLPPTVSIIMEAIDKGFQINTQKNLATIKQKENLINKANKSPNEELEKNLAAL